MLIKENLDYNKKSCLKFVWSVEKLFMELIIEKQNSNHFWKYFDQVSRSSLPTIRTFFIDVVDTMSFLILWAWDGHWKTLIIRSIQFTLLNIWTSWGWQRNSLKSSYFKSFFLFWRRYSIRASEEFWDLFKPFVCHQFDVLFEGYGR